MTRDLTEKQFLAACERHELKFTTMNGLGAWLKDMKRNGDVLYGCMFSQQLNLMRRASLANALQRRAKDLRAK